MKRAQLAVGAALAALLASALASYDLLVPKPAPKMGAAANPKAIVRYLDVQTRAQAGALRAIARHFDAKFVPDGGVPTFPGPGVCADPQHGKLYGMLTCDPVTGAAPQALWTQHETAPLPHPTQQWRYAIPMTAADAVEWTVLANACAARVDAGARGICVQIAAMPPLITTLDATWADEPEDGGSPNATTPPDDYPGVTP